MSALGRLRGICLSFPGAWEKVSHGEPTFWVKKRMFASFANAEGHHGAGRHGVWMKGTHATQDLLIAKSPDRYFIPAYVGASGWIGMHLDQAPDWSDVEARLRNAYDLAAAPRGR